MRPRGYLLLYGMVILALIMAAVLLLARAVSSRAQAQHVAAERNTALAGAESALEQARAELSSGKLTPGNSASFSGVTVACAAAKDGIELDALVPLEVRVAKSAAKLPRESVHVRWILTKTQSSSQTPQSPQWSVAEWHAQTETIR